MPNRRTTAYANTLLVSNVPTRFFGCTAYNRSATRMFLQLHDSAVPPAANAIPSVSIPIEATSPQALSYERYPRFFTNGIYACLSTTQDTLTLATPDLWIDCQIEGAI